MATIKIHPDLNSLYIQPEDKKAVLCPVCQGSGYIYPDIDSCYPPSYPDALIIGISYPSCKEGKI